MFDGIRTLEELTDNGNKSYRLGFRVGGKVLLVKKFVNDGSQHVSIGGSRLRLTALDWENIRKQKFPRISLVGIRPRRKLIFIDAQNMMYRLFFGVPVTKYGGKPNNIIRGVVSQIRTINNLFSDAHLVFVFDSIGKTDRHREYSEYKNGRSEPPAEFIYQVDVVKELVRKFGYPVFLIEGQEADDVIGTLCRTHTRKSIIWSSDKDFAQLVNKRVSVYDVHSKVLLDSIGIEHKHGVKPNQICDWLMLLGDKSDNIPGIVGCGKKTAVKWLTEFGDLDTLLDNTETLSKKMRESVLNNKFSVSRSLVGIRTLDICTDLYFTDKSRDLYKFAKSYGVYI